MPPVAIDDEPTKAEPFMTMAELVNRPACRVCKGSGRVGLCNMYECNHCAGAGVEYALEIVAEDVTFAPKVQS